jgi:hypothetical protein
LLGEDDLGEKQQRYRWNFHQRRFFSGHPSAESFNFRQIIALKSKKLKMGTAKGSIDRRTP